MTLDRADIVRHLPVAREPRKAPVVLGPEEVARMLEAAPGLKYKAALSVAYGAGLRVSEVVALKVSDIDSGRMMIRIEQGKRRKDRYAMLSPRLLDLLRDWWLVCHSRGWLFPGRDPLQPITTRQLTRGAREDCAPVAGKSTLNRLELSRLEPARYHKISHNPVAIKRLLVDLFLEAHERAPNEIILDLDATDDPVHGEQQGRFFHGYYDCYYYQHRQTAGADRPHGRRADQQSAAVQSGGVVSAFGRDARQVYDAALRSAWDSYRRISVELVGQPVGQRITKASRGAIAAARADDVSRLVDCLRGRKPLTEPDAKSLAAFIETETKVPRRRYAPAGSAKSITVL